MKLELFFSCTVIFCSVNCNEHNSPKSNIHFLEDSKVNSLQWKNDSGGCLGYRYKNVDAVLHCKDSLLHTDKSYILSFFGSPNQIEITRDSLSYFIYFFEGIRFCDGKGPFKTTVRDEEVMFIYFRFDKFEKTVDCRQGIP